VKVDLLIRDTCRLRPGVPGLSDNIHVVSIVGRFLEHTRIYYFRNGGDEEYFIGSADMMMRNLESRVEVVAPVEPAELREELRTILQSQLEDQRSAWDMQADGTYIQRTPPSGGARSCQETLVRLAEARSKDAERRKTRSAQKLRKRNIKR
jgi:polyphosphate kinase